MKIFFTFISLILFAHNANCSCDKDTLRSILRGEVARPVSGEIILSDSKFNELFENLNRTLSGNLATVYRSEWKAKNTFAEAIEYLKNIGERFDGNSSIMNSDKVGIERIEEVRHRLAELENINGLKIRDLPGTFGAKDRTFTYYTKSLLGQNGGKHQIRLRTYVRSIKLESIPNGQKVTGYFEQSKFELTRSVNGNKFEFKLGESTYLMSKSEATKRLGDSIHFYPAHGKNFKLEIKTRLAEEMVSESFSKLEGDNYVQKLSVGLSFPQAMRLFGQRGHSIEHINKTIEEIKAEINLEKPHQSLRTQAVFNVIKEGLKHDSNFTEFLGATEYGRLALEVKLGEKDNSGENIWAQTTFDFGMSVRSVFEGQNLMMPRLITKRNAREESLRVERIGDETHVELKVPKYLVERALESPENVSPELRSLLELYSKLNVLNRGKFNYIIQEGQ